MKNFSVYSINSSTEDECNMDKKGVTVGKEVNMDTGVSLKGILVRRPNV